MLNTTWKTNKTVTLYGGDPRVCLEQGRQVVVNNNTLCIVLEEHSTATYGAHFWCKIITTNGAGGWIQSYNIDNIT